MVMTIDWRRLPGNFLLAVPSISETRQNIIGIHTDLDTDLDYLSYIDMDKIQAWCEENHCGKRMSFDMFYFPNEKEIMAFLLRWS
jgi:hypothetical protein